MGKMHRRMLLGALAAGLTTTPPAHAATPIRDAEYAGRTDQIREITLLTAETRRAVRRIRFDWFLRPCEDARNGVRGTMTLRRAAVRRDGRFRDRARRRQRLRRSAGFSGGTQTVRARVRGRFIRQDTARGVLRLTVVVRNRAGLVVDRCATERAVRWTARLLGTRPEYELPQT